MMSNYEKLFSHFKAPEPPSDLFTKIMSHLHEERRLSVIKQRVVFFFVLLASSIAVAVYALEMIISKVSESGFVQFFSLLFSDFGAVATYWQSFLLSLAEALPVIALAIFLLTTMVFLESLKFLVKDVRFVFLHQHKLTNN